MKSALIGYATIALCVASLGYVVPDEQVRRPMWLFVFLALAASAKFCWDHPRAPKSPSGWLAYVGLAALACLALVIVHGFLYGVTAPTNSPLQAVLGSPRIILDLSFFVLGGIVAISGWARSLSLSEKHDA